jgi:hypothetical protein
MATTAQQAASASLHKRRANDLICESLRDASELEPIAFFCECPSRRCFDTVWMTAAEYETRRRAVYWAPRAGGH